MEIFIMCGRFACDIPSGVLEEVFKVSVPPDIPRRYNIAPTSLILAVRGSEAGSQLVQLRWGLVPSWAKDRSLAGRMINARSESVHEKPAFRQAIRCRRCIIPANGFFEWAGEGKSRRPYYIRTRTGSIMAFAGIWERWRTLEGELLDSCAILTTVANSLIRSIHDRMPVIIRPEEYNLWLDRSITEPEKLKSLYNPYPSELLEMYQVSSLVNTPRNDSVECIAPLN
jgi:putative SOS response-associated peptidase YedK